MGDSIALDFRYNKISYFLGFLKSCFCFVQGYILPEISDVRILDFNKVEDVYRQAQPAIEELRTLIGKLRTISAPYVSPEWQNQGDDTQIPNQIDI